MLSRRLLVSREVNYSLVGLETPLVTSLTEIGWSSESMYQSLINSYRRIFWLIVQYEREVSVNLQQNRRGLLK